MAGYYLKNSVALYIPSHVFHCNVSNVVLCSFVLAKSTHWAALLTLTVDCFPLIVAFRIIVRKRVQLGRQNLLHRCVWYSNNWLTMTRLCVCCV